MYLLCFALAIGLVFLVWFQRTIWQWWKLGLVLAALGLAVWAGVLTLPPPDRLDKVLGRLAMPAGLLWAALGIRTLKSMAALEVGKATTNLLFFLGLTVAGNPWVGQALSAHLQGPVAAAEVFTGEPYDAVLVLGGGTRKTETGHFFTARGGDRVVLGARLWHRGLAKRLVASGRSTPNDSAPHSSAEATEVIWKELGVPAEAIVRLDEPWNTRMEVEAFVELARAQGWARCGVVSSAVHLPRALADFDRLGFPVTPLPAEPSAEVDELSAEGFIPTGVGFLLVHQASWELVGSVARRFRPSR